MNMNEKPLNGKVALITGGGGPAMGRAHCLSLSRLGAHIIILDKQEDHAKITAKKISSINGTSETFIEDLENLSKIILIIGKILKKRSIDILVNHAGISGLSKPLEEIDENFFDKMFNIHVKSAFFITQQIVPIMKKNRWGRIINISSDFSMYGSPSASHYTAAKSALLGLTKSWARELAPWKITVNAVAPTLLKSELTIESKGEKFLSEESKNSPMGYLPKPTDVASVVGFLATQEVITGQTISPNGGRTIVGI